MNLQQFPILILVGIAWGTSEFHASAVIAITEPATNITASSADLAAYIDPQHGIAYYHWQYGLTTSYGSNSPTYNPLGIVGHYFYHISNLAPNTNYHFRIVAGSVYGADLSFKTEPL